MLVVSKRYPAQRQQMVLTELRIFEIPRIPEVRVAEATIECRVVNGR
jgi:hypothetical protein